MTNKKKMDNTSLFEVSWEVCNKVGGIYQVVSSKVLESVKHFGNNYYLLGPDLGDNAEFEETDEACWQSLRKKTEELNIPCRFGRWTIPGNPKVILVNFKKKYDSNQLLHNLWTRYGVDSLSGGWDYIEPVMFSTACSEVICAACETLVDPEKDNVLAHFHEWMCGAGLLDIKYRKPRVGTIFTTHATILGRSMAGSGFDIYKQMQQINPNQEAGSYNITAKYSMESISAQQADCFTTVSSITSTEAGSLLGKQADIVTPNGLDLSVIPDYSLDRTEPNKEKKKVFEAAGRLLRHEISDKTKIFLISGRYEFHNKGIDAFMDALAETNEALKKSDISILAICAAMGGHSGVNADAISGDPNKKPANGKNWITSHNIYNPEQDPILKTCARLGLENDPQEPVQFIFIPALFDGYDGFLNMTYYELLSACDLGVFPSWYEPWGYTPQESAALAVPTVTTDLSGFGNWVRDLKAPGIDKRGVSILPRRQTTYNETVDALKKVMLEYASSDDEFISEMRVSVRDLMNKCSWKEFFPHYIEAYEKAISRAKSRYTEEQEVLSRPKPAITHFDATSYQVTTPRLRCFSSIAKLPEPISRLRELANNLWWYWHPVTWKLFEDLNSEVWNKSDHNPILTIEATSAERFKSLANDPTYLRLYDATMKRFDSYMNEPTNEDTNLTVEKPVAYFSMEYGISECLPIYSGGLGVLSGDHLKSASDLNIPLIGIGLLYRSGYFRQELDNEGRQIAHYPENDFSNMTMERVLDNDGSPLIISIDEMPGRTLYAQVWHVQVGRIDLYLMDTDISTNTVQDRKITARLYESNRDFRLSQEILLGIGGIRMLKALNIEPSVFHMNEGHSAFLVLERIRLLMQEKGLTFAEASEFVKGSSLFTTHTPVEAGNEIFTIDRMEAFFKPYAQKLGISWNDLLRMGKLDDSERNVFEMTLLALNYSYKSNGVSAMHGVVSRHMWRKNWKGLPTAEVPIGHVTNGIHVPTYTAPAMKLLLDRYLGEDWEKLDPLSPSWNKINDIPDNEIWSIKNILKDRLIERIRESLPQTFKKYGIKQSDQNKMKANLTSNALIIGFARRFAPYKRATLLFANPERMQRILNNPERPVIFVFSGKAHPADVQGIEILQQIIKYSLDPRFLGKIFFLEDYSLNVSQDMVKGCDVWLNNPRRPREASGTSGQKVPVNCGINLSVSDGWWCEGYLPNENNGWTIGQVLAGDVLPTEQHDYDDAEALYHLLENEVLPLYFDRDNSGRPSNWIKVARNSMRTLIAQFSSNRMVNDYLGYCYIPAADRRAELVKNNMALTKSVASWKETIPNRFKNVRIGELTIEGLEKDELVGKESMKVTLMLDPGDLSNEELVVQLVVGTGNAGDFTLMPDKVDLKKTGKKDGKFIYEGEYCPPTNGNYAYGVRVMPTTEGLASPCETRLVLWA